MAIVFSASTLKAQLTGVKNIPGDYASLDLAIADLNTQGVGLGGVALNLVSSNPQTAPLGGYVIGGAGSLVLTTASATNPIIIAGNNNIVTAPASQASGQFFDGIFKIIGGDFITIQGFTLNENAANTTTTAASNNMTEWGIALLYASATNGCQNVSLLNNTITMGATYQNAMGIYANSTHAAGTPTTSATATSLTGGNHNLTIKGNTISNVNQGIVVVGPTAAADMNNNVSIGGTTPIEGNTITFGLTNGFSTYANVSGTVNGILLRNSINATVSNNSLTSNGTVTAGTLNGIQFPAFSSVPTGAFTQNVSNNSLTLRANATGSIVNGINQPSGSASTTSTFICENNDFNALGHTIASPTAAVLGIVLSSVHQTNSISSNRFNNLTVTTAGSFTFISNSINTPVGGTQLINNNQIIGTFNKTGAGGTVLIYTTASFTPAGRTITFTNNNFSNITLTGATTMNGVNMIDGNTSTDGPVKTISGNTFSNWTCGTNAVRAMYIGYAGNTAPSVIENNVFSNITGQANVTGVLLDNNGSLDIRNNQIFNLSSSGAGTGIVVAGISSSTGNVSARIQRNKIYNLSAANATNTTTTAVNGILVSAGTTINVENNYIGDLRAPFASALNSIAGINITGGTTANVYYNTVRLTASSAGVNFGTSAISAATGTNLTMNNNIFVNSSSANGTGLAVAYRRSSTTLTSYQATSNRNDFVASTIYTDETAPLSTLVAFQTAMATRDANSISEVPNFISITGSDANFLHINPSLPSGIESGGVNIAGITTDYNNDIRQGNAGYAGTGTAPDMGADEFETSVVFCSAANGGTISPATNSNCEGTTRTITSVGATNNFGNSYQWKVSTTAGGPYVNVTGGTGATTSSYTTATLTTGTYYYVLETTCSFGPLTGLSNEYTLVVNPIPLVAVTPSSATYCNPGTPVSLTASGASTYAWSPATGLSANTGATVNASPAATTTYTVLGSALGCTSLPVTVTVTVTNAPVISSITATPTAFCNSGNSQLQANVSAPLATDYLFSAGTSASLDPMVGATTVINSLNDDIPTAAPSNIGFSFPFSGTTYTQYSVSPDGWLLLGGAVALSDFSNQVTDPTNIPKIYPLWDDLATGTTGNVQTLVTGTAPNQIFIVQWSVTVPRNTAGPANSTFQAWLYENTGVIEFRYGTIGVATGTMSAGLTGSTTNYKSITFVTNTASSSVPNDNNTVVPVNGTIYTFTPPTYTYSWSPATFLNSTTITNPLATGLNATTNYTLSALANGCTTTATVTVTANPLPTAPTTTNSAQCGAQIPTASVVSTSGLPTPTFVWYDAAVAGTVLQTSTSTTYTSVVPSTTTLYVSELNTTTGCESTLTPVTITVASADLVQASIDLPTICIGQSVNLSVVNTNPSPLQSYTYTWSSTTGNGLVTSTGSAVTATPSIPGSYVFTVNGVDGGCNAVSSVNLTVNPFTATLAATNVTCFNAGNGSFSLTGSSCGTAPFSYSVDGGTFGPIPTNLTPGTYSVVTRDANLFTAAAQTIVITQPAAVNQPVGITNVSICEGVPSAQLVYTPVSTGSVTLPFALLAQPTEVSNFPVGTVAVNPNIISSATMPALPANAVITSVNFTFNNITATGGSWRSDVNFGFNGAVSSPYAVGAGALNSAGNFNYTLALSPASVSIAGGVVNLHYFDAYNDNAGSEATFPIGANVASMVINYTYTPAPSVAYYAAPTGGTSLGTGTPFETVGTTVLPNTNTPGVYNFYAAGVNGICESAARSLVTVTVNALPAVNAGVDQTVCEGAAVTLSGTVAGGTWNGPVVIADGVAFTPPAGVHTFTYSVTNAASCTNTDDVVVTVNALPVVNAGVDQTVCEGDAVTLSGTVAGGTWNGPVVIADGVSFTPPVGIHTFTYSVTNVAGCTDTDDVIVTVNAAPVADAGADLAVCDGEEVTFNGTGGTSPTWTGPVAVTNGTPVVLPVGVHVFNLTITGSNGCTDTDAIQVTVNALPTVVATDNLDATITASAGTTYQWIDCATDLPIAGATAQTYTVTANGSYAVIVNNGTCEDTSDCVVIDYIGINEVSQDMISVFPNPTRDFVTVNMTAANASIEVVDAQGKILQTSIVENGGTVSLASYETGMYIFRITTENGTSIHRISKN